MPRAPRDAPLKVAANKRNFLALLLKVAAGLSWCQATSERGRVYCVAELCGFRQGAVLSRALARAGMPYWDTVEKLAKGTGIPRTRWLIELGWLSRQDIGAAIDQEVAAPPLGPDEEVILAALRTVPPDFRRWSRAAAEDWLRLRAADQHSEPPPNPRSEQHDDASADEQRPAP